MIKSQLALQVRGNQQFMSHEIPVVLGGFGPDAKCVSDKTIAEIHGMQTRHVRELMNRNSKRFTEKVDCIDMKKGVVQDDTYGTLSGIGYSKQEITQAEHIYILSERGYAKLIKIMDTDLAWEIHDKLIDEYFELREGKKQTVAKAIPLSSVNNAARMIMKAYEEANVDPSFKVLALKEIYEPFGVAVPTQGLPSADKLYDKTAIAKAVGMVSTRSGRPHSQAIGAVISCINVQEDEMKMVPYMNNGHPGTTVQYTEAVLERVRTWLANSDYPCSIRSGDGTSYKVAYTG